MTPAGMFAMAFEQMLWRLGWFGDFCELVRNDTTTARFYFRCLRQASGAEWRR